MVQPAHDPQEALRDELYEQYRRVPAHQHTEIVNGTLYVMSRPGPRAPERRCHRHRPSFRNITWSSRSKFGLQSAHLVGTPLRQVPPSVVPSWQPLSEICVISARYGGCHRIELSYALAMAQYCLSLRRTLSSARASRGMTDRRSSLAVGLRCVRVHHSGAVTAPTCPGGRREPGAYEAAT